MKVKDYFNASLINNFATNDLFDESVPLDHWVGVNGNFKFENPLAFGSVKSGFINNHISTSVIPLKGSQFIPVLGLFQRLNLTSDLPVEGLVNEHNLKKEFEKSILVSAFQNKFRQFI